MSGCERGRRTRCETRYRNSSQQQSHHHPNQHQQHQHEDQHHHHHQHAPPRPPPAPWPTAAAPPAAQAPTTPVLTTPAQPSAPTQRPAQPAPAPPAAVPPPAPAPHAGICSVHVSMYAQDSKIYSYILRSKKNVGTQVLVSTRVWNAYSCSIQHTNKHAYTSLIARMQTLERWKWKRNKDCAQH